jgi:hypothetical protein
MRHSGCKGFDLHRALGQRRQVRKAFRGDMFAKDEHRSPLIAENKKGAGYRPFCVSNARPAEAYSPSPSNVGHGLKGSVR